MVYRIIYIVYYRHAYVCACVYVHMRKCIQLTSLLSLNDNFPLSNNPFMTLCSSHICNLPYLLHALIDHPFTKPNHARVYSGERTQGKVPWKDSRGRMAGGEVGPGGCCVCHTGRATCSLSRDRGVPWGTWHLLLRKAAMDCLNTLQLEVWPRFALEADHSWPGYLWMRGNEPGKEGEEGGCRRRDLPQQRQTDANQPGVLGATSITPSLSWKAWWPRDSARVRKCRLVLPCLGHLNLFMLYFFHFYCGMCLGIALYL